MTLYEITDNFRTLFDQLEELADNEELTTEEREVMSAAWYDTLESIEADFEEKAENIACYIKALKADADALAAEEKALAARRKSKERRIESLKSYLLSEMDAIHLAKIDRPRAKLSTRNNAESVAVDNDKAFIKWAQENDDHLLRYKEPEIDKSAVKALLQKGGTLPHVHLQRTRSVIIK